MTKDLVLGGAITGATITATSPSSGPMFTIPPEMATEKFAMLGMSGSGKSYGLGVLLEEMYKAGIPWIILDPANNAWGLRCKKDGTPHGYPIVVIGGDHGDLPLEGRDAGQKIAEALLAEPVCAVIDVTFESKNTSRKFLTEFRNTLMRHRPDSPRHIVIEESPEFCPQHARFLTTMECKAAVERLVTKGGNFDYGVTLASQRSATVDKDVLSQCSSLFVMRTGDKRDRKAIEDWIEAKNIGSQVKICIDEIASLKNGECWFWSLWLNRFERFRFRERETLHPRDMRKLGIKARSVVLADAQSFVERLKKQLSKKIIPIEKALNDIGQPPPKKVEVEITSVRPGEPPTIVNEDWEKGQKENEDLRKQVVKLQEELHVALDNIAMLESQRKVMIQRLDVAREVLRPQYEVAKKLAELYNETKPEVAVVDSGKYKVWMDKAPKEGMRKMIEALVEHKKLTRSQLCRLAGVRPGTGYNYISWIKGCGIIKIDRPNGATEDIVEILSA